MIKKHINSFIYYASAVVIILSMISGPASALDRAMLDFYSQNDIPPYFNDGMGGPVCEGGISVDASSLPSETVKYFESFNMKQKAEDNMERYTYASEQSGVPWQVIATIHYREASMDPTRSISNGAKLGSGVNVDGILVSSDPNKDAANLAEHLLRISESVYGLDRSSVGSWTLENWGEAFLAYNRGLMYKSEGVSYTKSPYVMTGIDKDHIEMTWQNADSYYKGVKYNNFAGNKTTTPGALAAAIYLGLKSGSEIGSTDNCGGVGGISGDITKTAIALSWPDRSHKMNDPNQAYIDAMKEVGFYEQGCLPAGADCGVFVATVMRKSGVDKNFPIITDTIHDYLKNSSNGYQKVSATNTSDLRPGDIFIISGHTFMYVGDDAGDGGRNMASASCSDRTADRGYDVYFTDWRGAYEIYRKI